MTRLPIHLFYSVHIVYPLEMELREGFRYGLNRVVIRCLSNIFLFIDVYVYY